MSEVASAASVPTVKGSRYLQQLCKHWAHNLSAELSGNRGRIVFPRDTRGADWPGEGVITLVAADDRLDCRIEATAPGQLEGLKGALSRHLDRFAFREAPLPFEWVDQDRFRLNQPEA